MGSLEAGIGSANLGHVLVEQGELHTCGHHGNDAMLANAEAAAGHWPA